MTVGSQVLPDLGQHGARQAFVSEDTDADGDLRESVLDSFVSPGQSSDLLLPDIHILNDSH